MALKPLDMNAIRDEVETQDVKKALTSCGGPTKLLRVLSRLATSKLEEWNNEDFQKTWKMVAAELTACADRIDMEFKKGD